jgi:Large polyvalent protein-associated domain 7
MATPDDTTPARARSAAPAENSVRPAKSRRKDAARPAEETKRAAKPARAAAVTEPVPEEVRKRFIQVKNRYYFPDGARAFTDRGDRLTTPSENTEVVRSLIAIAKARDWNEITVRGTERFRKETWLAGRMAGLEVRGYRPSELEQAHLVRAVARQHGVTAGETPEPSTDQRPSQREREPKAQERQKGLLTGRLIDHGRATYQHDRRAPMSYFVKLETPRGDRTIWGVDLERAFKESLTQPQIGDEVGLRSVRQDAVKVKTAERDAEGKVIGERDLETHRNRWIVEKRGFFAERAEAARIVRDATVNPKQAVKQHPELVGTYLQVHAAELAAKRFPDPEDRARFVAKVRSALADSVARGEPLPVVRLRNRAPERAPQVRAREAAPVR